MAEFMTFAKALEEKIRKDLQSEQSPETNEPNSSSHFSGFSLEYPHLSYILGQLSSTQKNWAQPAFQKSPYWLQQKPKRATPKRKAHRLSPEQNAAFRLLASFSALDPGFSSQELKTAFRLAIRKTHPDQGGTAEKFREVQDAYLALKKLM